jgi:hypothetical protein
MPGTPFDSVKTGDIIDTNHFVSFVRFVVKP